MDNFCLHDFMLSIQYHNIYYRTSMLNPNIIFNRRFSKKTNLMYFPIFFLKWKNVARVPLPFTSRTYTFDLMKVVIFMETIVSEFDVKTAAFTLLAFASEETLYQNSCSNPSHIRSDVPTNQRTWRRGIWCFCSTAAFNCSMNSKEQDHVIAHCVELGNSSTCKLVFQ